MNRPSLSFLLLFYLLIGQSPLLATVITADHVEIKLLIQDKESDLFGVHFKIAPDWHIYWKNPGDSGAAPQFNLNSKPLPVVLWPYPKRIPVSHLVNFGYEKEVILFMNKKDFKETDILNIEWLVCKVDCIPGFGQIQLKKENFHKAPKIWKAQKDNVPSTSKKWLPTFVQETKESFSFQFEHTKGFSHLKEIHIFPSDGSLFSPQTPKIDFGETATTVHIIKSPNAVPVNTPSSFTFVTETHNGKIKSFDMTVPLQKSQKTLWLGILFAFLGGLILNLMPCVFPVLFLKAYGFLKANNSTEIRKSSWLYSLGVIFSFLLLGLFIILLKQAGQNFGWGFQLQSPYVVSGLIILFFLMGLSFLDILKTDGFNLPPKLQPLLSGDFGTGVLAVIVASPCTAPFMGSALGMTLILTPLESLAIFAFIGVGLSFPVPLFAHWPSLINKLPRSGSWMIKVKKLMSIPLFLTCLWLSWVLSIQLTASQASNHWIEYEKKYVEELKKEQSFFIDFTAAWCITCQVNKANVLDKPEIVKIFQNHNIALIRADWSNYNKEITQALAYYGRNSVPFYVFYDHKKKQDIILPEILTKKEILKLFKKKEN